MMTTKNVSVTLKGYMSVADAEKLKADMQEALSTKATKIELDITDLEDIDVSTIQLLYAFYQAAGKKISITIVGKIPPLVKKVFFNCGLITSENISDDVIVEIIKDTLRFAS